MQDSGNLVVMDETLLRENIMKRAFPNPMYQKRIASCLDKNAMNHSEEKE